jgi:FkbM family methyltransferase
LAIDGRVLEQKFAYYYGEWEREYLEAAIRHYHRGTFYDIGGSIGLYAVTVGLTCAQTGRKLRSIEPLPDNLARLRANLKLNRLGDSTVTVHPIGLGDKPGSFQVALVAEGIPGNAKVVASGGVEVQVTTLDELWESTGREDVGFIKIDTEGFDVLILQGGRQCLNTCRPNLLVEFNRERMRNRGIDLATTWSFLTQELGYQCFRIDPHGREIATPDPEAYENLLFLQKT